MGARWTVPADERGRCRAGGPSSGSLDLASAAEGWEAGAQSGGLSAPCRADQRPGPPACPPASASPASSVCDEPAERGGWREEELQEGGAGGHVMAPGPDSFRPWRGPWGAGLKFSSEAPTRRWGAEPHILGTSLQMTETDRRDGCFLPPSPNLPFVGDYPSRMGHPAPPVRPWGPCLSCLPAVVTSRKPPRAAKWRARPPHTGASRAHTRCTCSRVRDPGTSATCRWGRWVLGEATGLPGGQRCGVRTLCRPSVPGPAAAGACVTSCPGFS